MKLTPALFLVAASLNAQDERPVWDQPAFSASPQALQRAFAEIEPGSNPVTVLLEEERYEFDSSGRPTTRDRTVFKTWTKEAASNWAMTERNWSPWVEDRPVVRARVTGPDGTVHDLDPKTMADAPAREGADDVLTDRRTVRVPLPAMEAGSIVEEEIVTRQTIDSPMPGTLRYFRFGGAVPVEHSRLQIRIPETLPFRYKVRLLPDVAISDHKEGGIREILFDQGPMKPLEDAPPLLPSDEPHFPFVVFSTASDWNSVAKAYAAIVDGQLRGFDASQYPVKFPPGATAEDKILAIVGRLNKEIRYTGVEFSEASLVPRKPAEVLQRKYGDCKDKSTLAVALLRAAGIDAYVVLLRSALDADIEPELPGIDAFNHAIVYVPGPSEIWLDPTDSDLRLHVISPGNQGRYALIARPQTTALMRTPELTARDTRIVVTREFTLSELGRAKVVETTETFGTADREYRGVIARQDQKKLPEGFKGYVKWVYGEAKIASITAGDAADLSKPFQLRIAIDGAQQGDTARAEAAVGIFLSQIALRLPLYFFQAPENVKKDDSKAAPALRTQDFAISEPFTEDWHYVIAAPPGFRVRQLPENLDEKLGPATLTARFASRDDRTVLVDFQFVMLKRRFTAAEGAVLRDAVLELGKRSEPVVRFDEIGEAALASGDVKTALAEFAVLRKLHPNEALHAMQTARALLIAGAGDAARAEARRAVALEPESAKAYVQMAEVLEQDLVGRDLRKGLDAAGAAAAFRKALEPEDAVRIQAAREVLMDWRGQDLVELLSRYARVDLGPDPAKAMARDAMSLSARARATGVSLDVAGDLALSATQYSREGSEETGWVIRLTQIGQGSGDGGGNRALFVTREDGAYRILAAPGLYAGVARLALKLVEQGQADQARTWLDRVRQEVPAGGGDDPLSGLLLSRLAAGPIERCCVRPPWRGNDSVRLADWDRGHHRNFGGGHQIGRCGSRQPHWGLARHRLLDGHAVRQSSGHRGSAAGKIAAVADRPGARVALGICIGRTEGGGPDCQRKSGPLQEQRGRAADGGLGGAGFWRYLPRHSHKPPDRRLGPWPSGRLQSDRVGRTHGRQGHGGDNRDRQPRDGPQQ